MVTTSTPATPATRTTVTTGLNAIDWIALILMIIGSINWGLIGIADFNLVAVIFGAMSVISRIIYVLVGLAGLWGIVMAIKFGNRRSSPAV